MTEAMQAFVVDVLGPFFVEPPTFDLRGCYEDSSVTMPLIFVLSTGSDPNKVPPLPPPELKKSKQLPEVCCQEQAYFRMGSNPYEVPRTN